MGRTLSYIAKEIDEGLRLDLCLTAHGFYQSRSASARAISEQRVYLNGKIASKSFIVSAGDTIVYETDTQKSFSLLGEAIPLDIRYEDEFLIVLSKQAGLVCHPSEDYPTGTLVNALIEHCGPENLCNVQGETDRMGIVHRLDRDTTGLMLAAKNDQTGLALMNLIQDKEVERKYIALVHGVIAVDSGLVDAPIDRNKSDRTKMAVVDSPNARDALTTFKVLERFEHTQNNDGYTLVECKLYTGRTHQIRVHMQYIHHPLVGDPQYRTYMPKRDEANRGLTRQFLHSYSLSFTHPNTDEQLSFLDNLSHELRDLLISLAPCSMGKTSYGEEVFAQLSSAPFPKDFDTFYESEW